MEWGVEGSEDPLLPPRHAGFSPPRVRSSSPRRAARHPSPLRLALRFLGPSLLDTVHIFPARELQVRCVPRGRAVAVDRSIPPHPMCLHGLGGARSVFGDRDGLQLRVSRFYFGKGCHDSQGGAPCSPGSGGHGGGSDALVLVRTGHGSCYCCLQDQLPRAAEVAGVQNRHRSSKAKGYQILGERRRIRFPTY